MNGYPFIGIDLGTTFSVAAYVDAGGHVVCVPNGEGEALTPSAVWLTDDGRTVVGRPAREAAIVQPDRAALAFKRRMGEPGAAVTLGDRTVTPEFLSSRILAALAEDARRAAGGVGGAVITVPAYFGDRQRSATREAARQAGLDLVAMINEPTAAAIAHAFESYVAAGGDPADLETASIASTAPGISVICDLGGGTFDVTAVRVNGNRFDVLATGGSLTLGGNDWDERIADELERHLLSLGAPDPHHDPHARARMLASACAGKHVLSVKPHVEIAAPYENVMPMTLARERFEAISDSLLGRVREVIERVIADAALQWAQVNDLLLVGGGSRMPMIRRLAGDISGLTPNTRLQPDLVIAQGAAVYAAILQVQGRAVETAGDGSPARASRGRRPDAGARPARAHADPLVAEAAADAVPAPPAHWYREAFAAAAADVQVHDVNSRSLGVIVRSPRYDKKVNHIIIPRNTPLPATASHAFVTRFDDQTHIQIPIVEGETRKVEACTQVGTCCIDGLPPKLPKGSPVEVTIAYDADGTVKVRAREVSSGTAAETTLDRRACARTAGRIDELARAVANVVHVAPVSNRCL